MWDMAWISYASGVLTVPLDGRDDEALIYELVDCYGEVKVSLGSTLAQVQMVEGYGGGDCMRCGRRLQHLVCVLDVGKSCVPCFKALAKPEPIWSLDAT